MSQAIGPFGPAGAKLPLGATIGLSYSTYFRNFLHVLRASWIWLLLVALLNGIVGWLQVPPWSLQMIALGILGNLLVAIAGVSIAVAWHRRIILDERPGFSGSNVITESFWRYVWVGILISLLVSIPVLAIGLPTVLLFAVSGTPSALAILLFVTLFVAHLAAIAVFLRVSLLFPAHAAGDVGLTFSQTWDRTRGNTWRLLWGIVACTLLPVMLMQIVSLLLIGFPSPDVVADPSFAGGFAAFGTIMMVCYQLILPIGIGFLSHAYRHFFRPA